MFGWELKPDLILGLASSALGLELLRAVISRWSADHDAAQKTIESRKQEERDEHWKLDVQLRADYQQLREENRQIKAEIRTLEQKYFDCETRAMEIREKMLEAERGRIEIREKLQLLQ